MQSRPKRAGGVLMKRVLAPMAACAAATSGVGVFVVLSLSSRPARFGMHSAGDVPEAALQFSGSVIGWLIYDDFGRAALELGFGALWKTPITTVLLLLVALVAGFLLVVRHAVGVFGKPCGDVGRECPGKIEDGNAGSCGVVCGTPAVSAYATFVVIGTAMLLGGSLPVVLSVEYGIADSRMMYVLLPGVVIGALGVIGLGDRILGRWLLWRSRGRGPALYTAGVLFFTFLVANCVMLVGLQSLLRKRYLLDLAQSEQLRRLVGEPQKNSYFLCLQRADGWDFTDALKLRIIGRYSRFSYPWIFSRQPRFIFGRDDLYAGVRGPGFGGRDLLLDVDVDAGLIVRYVLPDNKDVFMFKSGGVVVPWENIVGFRVLATGEVELVDDVRAEVTQGHKREQSGE